MIWVALFLVSATVWYLAHARAVEEDERVERMHAAVEAQIAEDEK